jgi:hypothetical protein
MDGLEYLIDLGIICNSLTCSKILVNAEGCVKIGRSTIHVRRPQVLSLYSGILGRKDTTACLNCPLDPAIGISNGIVDAKI